MRISAMAVGTAFLCILVSSAVAADLTFKPQKKYVKAEPKDCLRWIEQTYSWYNYCDPVPYYGRGYYKYVWKGGPPFN